MRFRSLSNALTLATAAGSLVAAAPSAHNSHKHHHDHSEHHIRRDSEATAPAVIFEVNGQTVSEGDVCEGINDGSLKWAEGTNPQIDCAVAKTTSSIDAASSTPAPLIPTSEDLALLDKKAQPTIAPSSTKSEEMPTSQGLDEDFPDDTIDCSTFPSDFGPIPIEWAQLGGWSGIQYVTIFDDMVTNIVTGNPGDTCKSGAMCSYACPPGYQKSQWPATQGSTGQSVGGLKCNSNGKLSLTNSDLSKKLCIPGTGATVVHNKLSENAAICRTDYPGTEAEVIPLDTQPDSMSNLTCPDASSYFTWEGAPTSAQYYINNQGVVVSNACTWGSDGTDMGNWAPSYLGVGQDIYGKTWLSISSTAQNDPTNYKALNYTVEIVGNTSGKCKLSKGRYCSGDYYDDCNDYGCTVSSPKCII